MTQYNLNFVRSYLNANLNDMKMHWKNDQNINIHDLNEHAFVVSCINDRLEIAKWLWEISNESINIHVQNDQVFRRSCKYGYIEMVKWLWEISLKKDTGAQALGMGGKAADRKFILDQAWNDSEKPSVSGIGSGDHCYYDTFGKTAIELSCENDHFDLAKWLISVSEKGMKINEKLSACICDDLKYCTENYEKLQSIDKMKNNRFVKNPKLHIIHMIKKVFSSQVDVIHDVIKMQF